MKKDMMDEYERKPIGMMIIMTVGVAVVIIGIIFSMKWVVEFLFDLIF